MREKWNISTFELAIIGRSWSTIKTWEMMEAVTVGPPGASHAGVCSPTAEQVELLKKLQRGEDVHVRE